MAEDNWHAIMVEHNMLSTKRSLIIQDLVALSEDLTQIYYFFL